MPRNWATLVRHFREYWRGFVAASVIGLGLPISLIYWKPRASWVEGFLNPSNTGILILVFVSALVLLIIYPRHLIGEFSRRYWNTASLERHPLHPVELIAVGSFWSFITMGALTIALLVRNQDQLIALPAFIDLLFLLGVIWIAVPLLWRSQADLSQTESSRSLLESGGNSDLPISDDDQDELGRVPFVDGLYQQIINLSTQDPFVFSLDGTWGEGKTSVLNLLRKRLTRHQKVILVDFNPWFLATETALVHSFYAAIDQAVQRRYLTFNLSRLLNRYSTVLTSGLRSVGFGLELPIRDDPKRLQRQIENWLNSTGCRLIVIIDDLDRLQAKEVLSVLKLTSLSARLRNSIFVLSFDHTVVRGLLGSPKNDPHYLEKAIQKHIPMPQVERRDIDRFLLFSDLEGHRSKIDRLFDELGVDDERRKKFDRQFVVFYQTTLSRCFTTIRRAKRYVNGLRSTLPPVLSEVNLYDFCLLEAIRVFYPEVYGDIRSNAWFYLPHWAHKWFIVSPVGLVLDENDKLSYIRTHVDEVANRTSEPGTVKAILEEIFYVNVAKAFGNLGPDSVSVQDRAEKRLTHPDCFPKYFLGRLPYGELSDKVAQELIRKWNGASLEDAEIVVRDDLSKYRREGFYSHLLEKLRVFVRVTPIRSDHVRPVVRGIYMMVPDLSRKAEGLDRSEYNLSGSFLLRLIEENSEDNEVHSLVEEVVQKVPAIHFAVVFVILSSRSAGNDLYRIAEHTDMEKIRQCAGNRLCAYFIDEGRDIFADLAKDDFGIVLYQWGSYWGSANENNRRRVWDYVSTLIEVRHEYLGYLLARFVHFREIIGDDHTVETNFEYQELSKIVDPAVIAELVRRYGSRAAQAPEEQDAIDLFRKVHSEKSERGRPPDKEVGSTDDA
ncbi:MAG: hypothetical protein IH977_08155 [Nitrospinae bacterium]|nr:hypothetical protein [Nitrospinota bacterium]